MSLVGEIAFYIFIVLIVIVSISKVFEKSKEEKEEERVLNESLADEFIYEPVSGKKITLEQAESGNWDGEFNLNRIKSEDEIEKYYFGQEKETEKIINTLKSKGYQFKKPTSSQVSYLEKSAILKKYDDWTYSKSFSIDDGKLFVIFPNISLKTNSGRHISNFNEEQMLFWIQMNTISGHSFFRKKTVAKAVVDLIINEEDINLKNYECFTFKKSNNRNGLLSILNLFDNELGLEIETNEGNLLIKTVKAPSMEDFLRIDKVIQNIS